jgi:hypothetical protein
MSVNQAVRGAVRDAISASCTAGPRRAASSGSSQRHGPGQGVAGRRSCILHEVGARAPPTVPTASRWRELAGLPRRSSPGSQIWPSLEKASGGGRDGPWSTICRVFRATPPPAAAGPTPARRRSRPGFRRSGPTN